MDSSRHVIEHRRRREKKTDYDLRLALLKSGLPRLVVRKSNMYIYAQLITYSPDGDEVVAQADSSQLSELGWDENPGNTAAAYLTGILLGSRADVDEAVLDIGLQRSTPGNKLYACLKGALDAGLEIPHDPEMLPPEERYKGQYIDAGEKTAEVREKILGETDE